MSAPSKKTAMMAPRDPRLFIRVYPLFYFGDDPGNPGLERRQPGHQSPGVGVDVSHAYASASHDKSGSHEGLKRAPQASLRGSYGAAVLDLALVPSTSAVPRRSRVAH